MGKQVKNLCGPATVMPVHRAEPDYHSDTGPYLRERRREALRFFSCWQEAFLLHGWRTQHEISMDDRISRAAHTFVLGMSALAAAGRNMPGPPDISR
jgi:hypothetical protein